MATDTTVNFTFENSSSSVPRGPPSGTVQIIMSSAGEVDKGCDSSTSELTWHLLQTKKTHHNKFRKKNTHTQVHQETSAMLSS